LQNQFICEVAGYIGSVRCLAAMVGGCFQITANYQRSLQINHGLTADHQRLAPRIISMI